MSDVVTSANDRPLIGAPASARSTAQFGVIVYLASDVMLFAAFFAAYYLLRSTTTEPWPPEDVELDFPRALAATLVLVASSFTLAASDRAGERPGGMPAMRRWLLVTIFLGAVFLVNQITEYMVLDFGAGDHPYGSAYWLLTGLHGAHVTAGLALMGLLFVRSVRSRSHESLATWAGGTSLFWHLVDIIWVFVFMTIWVIQ